MNELIAVVIGGFLAAGAGLLLDWRREHTRISGIKKLLTIGICDDLRHSISLYEKIAEDWKKTQTVWFLTINEFRQSRYVYQNNKDWIMLFSDEHLRKDIFRYYLQSADSINSIEYQQQRKYEIEKQLKELAGRLRADNQSLDHDQALATALGYMGAESKEYGNLNNLIPDLVRKLDEHKSTAERLLAKLESGNL